MNSDSLAAVAAVILGTISLFTLLIAVRHRLPMLLPSDRSQLHRVLHSQAHLSSGGPQGAQAHLVESITSAPAAKRHSAKLTLAKRLRYARWQLSPSIFLLCSACLSGIFLSIAASQFNIAIQVLAVIAGPFIMNVALDVSVDRRGAAFDADYSQFLMSMVGLLRTGMTATGALETAARGLKTTSLVRQEVLLLLERIRMGVPEDASIGAFGEDVYHPELELFVQALLLSNRIGGNLSESLERLSKQVRKRQYFKTSAISAVSLQRGSLAVIIAILFLLEGYLALVSPRLVLDSLATETGRHIWQVCAATIVLSIVWIRRITKLRV